MTVSKTSSTDTTRTSNTSTTVWTLPGNVPEVNIAAPSAKVLASSRVILSAQVKSTYPYTARWMQAQGDLVLPDNAIDANATTATNGAFALPLTSLNNVILKNKLTPGLTYVFHLIATDVNGNQGFGSVAIKVDSPPSSGRFEVTPKSGYAVQDSFSLSCAEWTDDTEDLPLKYSFGVITTSEFDALVASTSLNVSSSLGALLKTKTVPFVSDQLLPKAVVTMLPPTGLKASENITVIAFISDALGGFAFDSESIEVLLPPEVKSDPLRFVSSMLSLDSGAPNASDVSQRSKFLLSAASILEGAYTTGSNDTSSCSSSDVAICSNHGVCDPDMLKCVCSDAYIGMNCKFDVSAVRLLNTAILSNLDASSRIVEPTTSALSQQALIMDTIIQSSPAAFNQDGLAQVAALSTGIVENAFGLQDQSGFLDSAGKTVVDLLSTVVSIASSDLGTTSSPASSSMSSAGTNGRRLASSVATIADCNNVQPESDTAKATFGSTIGTLLSLTAIASQDALPDEDAIAISSTQIQALASAGASFTSPSGLSVRLTEPATACLESELFLSAFVLSNPPHSMCSLRDAKQLSASTVFTVHSRAALNAALLGSTASVKVQTLSSASLCVAQAAAKTTSAEIASSATRRLAASTSGLDATATAWRPLIALLIPHLRPLSAIEQQNFTTACQVWNVQSSAWDPEICFKDDTTSTPAITVCYCSEIAKLEVLVTLEERLDYYTLYKDLHRNEPTPIVPSVTTAILFWMFILGSRAGQRMDSTDAKKHKEKTIKHLNRAKWGELQERTTQNPAVLEDFMTFYARKKPEKATEAAAEANHRLAVQSGVTDAATTASSVTLGDDVLDTQSTALIADVVTASSTIDPNVVLPNEARTLFGANKTLEAQYAFILGCFRFCNVVVVIVGVILAFIGIDFHLVLGNSTSELLLYVYGKPLGLVLIVFGGVLVATGLFGLAAARKTATHTSRNTYLSLLSLLLTAQLAFVTITFKYLDDLSSMPSALFSTLGETWAALSAEVKEEVESFYGCCGFLSIKEASACPEEALDAVPPRTCSHVLAHQAQEVFTNSFVYLELLFLVEAVCITLANILVKWCHLRLQQLAGEPASSVNGETSAKRAMLSSSWNVVLLCTLPSLCYLLSCVVVFAVFYGVDMVIQLNYVSNAMVSALYGVEIGGVVIAAAAVYLAVLLRGTHALAYRDARGLQWFVALSLAFLAVSFGILQFLWGIGDNLLIDPVLVQKTESRYLSLPRDTLVKLEVAMECCGFDATSEGTCVSSTNSKDHQEIRTCRSIVEQILVSGIAVFNTRVVVFVAAEAAVFALSVVLLVRLRRFTGTPSIHPSDLIVAPPVEPDEYQTAALDIFVHNACLFVLVLFNVVASVLGLIVLWAGIDAIYQLNVLHVSYLLQTFDRRIGVHLVALGGGLKLFACIGFAVAWKRSRKVFIVYFVTGLALFASTFGALGVSYRFAHTTFASDATDFRLEELWKGAASTTKVFVQNAFTCCGYEKTVAANGTTTGFTDMADATFWTQADTPTTAHSYTRSLQSSGSSSDLSATTRTTTRQVLTETQTQTFTKPVCPPGADIGCSTVMKNYLVHVTNYSFQVCIALLAFLVMVLASASVLFLRQGKKPSWKQSWVTEFARTGLLLLSFGSIFASLSTLFIAIDLTARWSIFSSSLLQLLFTFSIGIALLVYALFGPGVNFYSLYTATNSVVHQIFFQSVGRGIFALSLWVDVGLTGYLSRFSGEKDWQDQLSSFLDHQWNTLTPHTQHLISLDYQCCGFNDPVVMKGKGIMFDRPAIGFMCPLSSARGCQHVLMAQIGSSFRWLFVYLLCLAVAETLLLWLGVLLLKQLKRAKQEEWFAIESRVRYVVGKYRSEVRRHHLALSLFYCYDPKFTRGQRLCSILCAVLTTLAVYTGYFAIKGCHRKSLKTCEQPDVWAVLGMGVVYDGLAGYAAQCGCRFLFELIRHRCDDETSEIANARQRKEKVLLFRSLFQRHRPKHGASTGAGSSPSRTDLHPQSGKVGVSSSAVGDSDSFAPSTMDTSHSTTEERWFTWLSRFVYRLFHVVAACLLLLACGIGTLMGLVLIGYRDTLYGVKIDQGPRELLILSLLIGLVSLLAWLAIDMKNRKRGGSHVVFIAVAIASLLLMVCALLGVYMIYEVTAVADPSSSADNWTVRKASFSVVERLERAWNSETSTYFRNRVQQDLQCCGFRSASGNAYRPCPTGTSVQVEYKAQSVNGTAITKEQTEVRDLDGCLPKMLELFHGIADTAAYFAIGICSAQFLLGMSAMFLAYDVVISKDSKLKLRVNDERKADVRQTFEKVVGLKIAAPARGKILSKMLSSSLNSVAPSIASELAAAPLTVAPEGTQMRYSTVSSASPAVSSTSKLANSSASTDTVLSPQRRKSLSANRGVRMSLEDESTGHHEEIASVPYPASIVYVAFALCGVWVGVMAYLVVHSSMELGKITAWRCAICWCVGLGFHFLIVEPGVIFAQIVWSTLGAWWSGTWLVRLVRYGREALCIRPDAATAAARYYASLSLYERIRFNAAVRIQRRLLTRVMRRRYLQLVRERRQESHRALAEQRRLIVRKAIEGFTEEEIRAFSIIFQDADPAKLGLVSHTVISQSIYQLGVRVSSGRVFKFLYDLDPAYADLVDFEHFLYGMHCVRMHHQEEQQTQALAAQIDVDAAVKQKTRSGKEEFVSSSARFGPAADPQSKIFVKRQNLLRELKEKHESLSYKLMSKVGKLPPILQRGKSSKTNLLPAAAATDSSASSRAKGKKNELSLDDISEQNVLASESADEAPPTGAYVTLQNRKLSPKKRALEMVLKKKHRDDRGKAAAAGVTGGGVTNKVSKLLPSKTQSPTQRAKTMMQNWKMPSPRGWSPSHAGGRGVETVEASIAPVAEEDSEVMHKPEVAQNARIESQSPEKHSIVDDVTTLPPQVSSSQRLVPSEESNGSPLPDIAVRSSAKEETNPGEIESAATESKEVVASQDAVDESLQSEAAALGPTEVFKRKASDEDPEKQVHDPSAPQNEGVEMQTAAPDGDEDDVKETQEAHQIQCEEEQKEQGADDEGEGDGDGDEEKVEEPKPFGTYILLNKQAPSAGKSKIMENILQKRKQAEAKADASTDGSTSKPLEGKKAAATGEVTPSEAKYLRPQIPEKKPATAAAKSSLEKVLNKSLAKGAAAGATSKASGLRKPATLKKL